MGGAYDPQSLLLALVMHVQIRLAQGLCAYVGCADLKWAFDVANVAGMLLNCFDANVVSTFWCLMNDMLQQDKQCLQLHGVLSDVFVLGCGTAQGRRFSIHVFNGLLTWLPVELEAVVKHGSSTVLPPLSKS